MAIKLMAALALALSLNLKARTLEYKDREHSFEEVLYDQSIMFAFHLGGFVATQYKGIQDDGSFKGYKDRFFRFYWDPNNPGWNLAGHTLTGSQVYLFYRAKNYTREKSFLLSALSSLYFEVFIETYTVRPSGQDSFHTPLFGSILGHGLESASVALLESEKPLNRFFGRLINPFSFLLEEGSSASVVPTPYKKDGFKITWTGFYD